MLAFSVSFHLAFGLHLYRYRGLGTTFMTLIRFALGDVDVGELLRVNSILGVLLTLLFTFVVYLQLIGIAVAVLLRFYQMQPSDKAASFRWVQDAIGRRDELLAQAVTDARAAQTVVMSTIRARRARTHAGNAKGSPSNNSFARKRLNVSSSGAPSFGVLGARAVGDAGGGWVKDEEDDEPSDPMHEAEAAFGVAADDPAQRAVADTAMATERLKGLYIEMLDGQKRTLGKLQQVTTVVRAVRDENFALAAALKAKGVVLPPEHDPTVSYLDSITGGGGSPSRAAGRRAGRDS